MTRRSSLAHTKTGRQAAHKFEAGLKPAPCRNEPDLQRTFPPTHSTSRQHRQDAGTYSFSTMHPSILTPITHRAKSPSARSRSSPKRRSRTAPSHNGSVCAPAIPSGKDAAFTLLVLRAYDAAVVNGKCWTRGRQKDEDEMWLTIPNFDRYNAKRRHWRKTRIGI